MVNKIPRRKLKGWHKGAAKKPQRPVWQSLAKAEESAQIMFADAAMVKMLTAISVAPCEVGWHGSGRRLDTGQYIIDDIYIYPQKVGPASIRVGDETYVQWMIDEVENHTERAESRCLHGHSHVNMGVQPSWTDTDYQADTIEMIPPDGFYIFLITNKRLNFWFNIVDRVDGLHYADARLFTASGALAQIAAEYRELVDIEGRIIYGHR